MAGVPGTRVSMCGRPDSAEAGNGHFARRREARLAPAFRHQTSCASACTITRDDMGHAAQRLATQVVVMRMVSQVQHVGSRRLGLEADRAETVAGRIRCQPHVAV